MSQKTKVQIINETVEYYRKNHRSFANGSCVYLNEDTGTMCAVSRCATPEGVKLLHQHEGRSCSWFFKGDVDVSNVFKPEYIGHSTEFWKDLQLLHDDTWKTYWVIDTENLEPDTINTLTEQGKSKVAELLERYKD